MQTKQSREEPTPKSLDLTVEELAVVYAAAVGNAINSDLGFRHTAFVIGPRRVALYRHGTDGQIKYMLDLPETIEIKVLSQEEIDRENEEKARAAEQEELMRAAELEEGEEPPEGDGDDEEEEVTVQPVLKSGYREPPKAPEKKH